MSALVGPVASGIIAAMLSAVGVYVAITNRLTRTETLIEELRRETEKHNSIIERTYKLESNMATQWKRLDELRDRMEKVEDKL